METEPIFDLTPIIGDCGIFQVLITLSANSASMVCVWAFMFMTFGAYNPGWTCLDRENIMTILNNNTELQHDNSSMSSLSSPNIDFNDTQWSMDCSVRKGCQRLVYNPDASTIVSQFDLSCESSLIPSVIISIEMAGALFGCYSGGQIGDSFGRKISVCSHLAIHTICHAIAPFSVSWKMYAAVLFVMGFGAGGVLTNSFIYALEFTSAWWRGIIISIPEWSFSFFIFTVIVYFVRNWMYLHIIGASLSLLVLLAFFWTPESIRWLTVSGKVEKAKRVIERLARMNGKKCPDTRIISNLAKEEKAQMGEHTYTYIDLFKIPELRCLSIKLGVIWIILGLFFYGISFGLKSIAGNIYTNLILSAVLEIPAIIFVGPLVNNLGRRKAALFYIALTTLCCFIVVVVFFETSGYTQDISILVLALISKMLVVGIWAIFYVFCSELFPTVLRTIGLGYLNFVSRISTIVAPYLFPNDHDLVYISFTLLGVLSLVTFAFTWSLSETKERPMKDIVFDKMDDTSEMKAINSHELSLK